MLLLAFLIKAIGALASGVERLESVNSVPVITNKLGKLPEAVFVTVLLTVVVRYLITVLCVVWGTVLVIVRRGGQQKPPPAFSLLRMLLVVGQTGQRWRAKRSLCGAVDSRLLRICAGARDSEI